MNLTSEHIYFVLSVIEMNFKTESCSIHISERLPVFHFTITGSHSAGVHGALK